MITYNAKDLIEQAQMLADLQNSDFISWKENVMFMDNAWTDLYQQIINHGDKSFLQDFTFTGNSCMLPDDFHQLFYVCYNDGITDRPITRKAKTSNIDGPYYDLVGNELVIYNKNNSIRSVKVQYYPVKEAITFASPDYTASRPDGNFIDCSDRYVLTNAGIFDIVNGKKFGDYNNATMLCGSIGISNTLPTAKKDNKGFLINGTSVTKLNGNAYKTINESVKDVLPVGAITAMTDDGIYYVSNKTLHFVDFETGEVTDSYTDLVTPRVYSFDNCIYYERPDGIYCGEELLIPSTDYDTFLGVMKVDSNTGYGILVETENKYVIKSAYKNTVLDYPNNFYYNYLAYKLAIYYKIKQGADASGLSYVAEEAMKTFYDTVNKDINEYTRIANVYAR